jgi:hypothetical protein
LEAWELEEQNLDEGKECGMESYWLQATGYWLSSGYWLPLESAFYHAKHAQNGAKTRTQGPFRPVYGKFSANRFYYSGSSLVTLTLQVANFAVHVSKDRNHPSEPLRGK